MVRLARGRCRISTILDLPESGESSEPRLFVLDDRSWVLDGFDVRCQPRRVMKGWGLKVSELGDPATNVDSVWVTFLTLAPLICSASGGRSFAHAVFELFGEAFASRCLSSRY